ncbi:autotransporter outer membrane beta-barrel domain-containing protein [Fusobacterium perfoetens]|uniref:autotransporter outer membrane beta-barrel domain-containing protein n=1 Tax=Fusobacterium perfoetens TaxID=852 RepID=UPI0004873B08|nr:autotransporter outer membrane beta-barrel domain-containing protein [Fusobacterium perfoetens]
MNKMSKEEKLFKRYLKKKVSFDVKTLVKYLITGSVVLSLTACGGGGGGSSSGPSYIPRETINNTEAKTDSTVLNNKNYNNEGSVTLTKGTEGIVGIAVLNGDIDNRGNISITKKNSNTYLAMLAMEFLSTGSNNLDNLLKQGNSIGIYNENGKLVNNAMITVFGNNSIGIYGKNSDIQNRGTINVNGLFVNGIKANGNIKIENNGNINIISDRVDEVIEEAENNYSIGINGETSSQGIIINNGIITMESNIYYYKTNENEQGNIREGYKWNNVIGMLGKGNVKVINNKNINIKNNGLGMVGYGNATIENNGNIIVNGKNKHETEGDVSNEFTVGIELNNNSKGINNGMIVVNGDTDNRGVVLADLNSNFINEKKGEIKVSSTEETYTIGIQAMRGEKNQELGIKQEIITNKGKVTVSNTSENGIVYGIKVSGSLKDNLKVINEKSGVINVTGNKVVIGMKLNDTKGEIINDGIINVNGNSEIQIDGYSANTGMTFDGPIEGKKEETIVRNNGTINVIGLGSGMSGLGIGTIINDKTGRINVENSGYGILGYSLNGDIINKGIIEVKDSLNIENSLNEYKYGIKSNSGNVTNEGIIKINSNKKEGSYGIEVQNENLDVLSVITNEKEGLINISGSYVEGISAVGNVKSINKGTVIIEAKSSIGEDSYGYAMTAYNGAQSINEGIITVGENSSGMKAEGVKSKITNKGTINVEYNALAGMEVVDNGILENVGKINIEEAPKDENKILGNEVIPSDISDEKLFDEIQNVIDNFTVNETMLSGIVAKDSQNIVNSGNITGTGFVNGIDSINSNVKNDGKIELTSSLINSDITITHQKGSFNLEMKVNQLASEVIGMNGNGGSLENGENGIISIIGSGVGINAINGATVTNNGNITMNSMELLGSMTSSDKTEENGAVSDYKSEWGALYSKVVGINGEGAGTTIVNGETGKINLTGSGVGINVSKGAIATNKGEIIINPVKIKDGYEEYIEKNGENITNEKNENLYTYVVGMTGKDYGTEIINEGIITMTGANGVGIEVFDGASAINKKEINVNGKNAEGMSSYKNSSVTNEGTINVGKNSYGMTAEGQGSQAINKGTINVGAGAYGGMMALNGGYIYNSSTGVINIDKSLGEGLAMMVDETSKFKNEGRINAEGDVTIGEGATYIVGTTTDGKVGVINADNVDLNGNVKLDTTIAKGTYKDSYDLGTIVNGDVKLGENYKVSSNSIFYDANTELDDDGNLKGTLERNDNSVSDYVNKNFMAVAGLFDNYLENNGKYEELTSTQQELVDNIFTSSSSIAELRSTIADISGTEYLSISRQIFDIKDEFVKYDNSVIDNISDYNFNIEFIGGYSEVDSKNDIDGYESKMTGFNGAMKLGENLYGTLGYGYSDIDYDKDSKEKIQTIHMGLQQRLNYGGLDIKFGLSGEYNFHEMDRGVQGKIVNSDFDSYIIGLNGEISKKYGEALYMKPYFSLDANYGKIKGFKETGDIYNLEFKSQDYTSVIPEIGLKLGKKYDTAEIYGILSYGYELGNISKDEKISINGGEVELFNNEMNNDDIKASLGTKVDLENISFNVELGKEFGKRDREYVKVGFSYKF